MTDNRNEQRGMILVADDEPAMRLALREVLRRAGWTVLLANDAPAAIEAIGRIPAIDLLLTDFRMPGLSGLDLLREARRLRPTLRSIMMTAYGTVEDAVAAMREGASDYLLKPFSMETVLGVVDRVMNQSGLPAAAREPDDPARPAAAPAADSAPITRSPAMRRVLEVVQTVAEANSTVLLSGESGAGKEVVARALHRASGRTGPFVAVNCAALPEGLLESELFGHEKGAFTGALQTRKGRFEQADGGTLLLDEISEMPPALQAKLLRVLQEREVSPVGSGATLRLDVRVVATTNRDLEQAVREGSFRQDLFYRLHVIALRIPPLRERREDIAALAEAFVAKYRRPGRPARRLAPETLARLAAMPWPGNVRELENMIERACLLARGEEILAADLTPGLASADVDAAEAPDDAAPFALASPTGEPLTLSEMERRLILATLERTGGNRTRTADLLGVSVRTIRNKLNEYGLKDYALAGTR